MLLGFGFNQLSSWLILALVVVVSMTVHEYAHGLAAKWNGDYTAKLNGRLTLNPLAHFDLIGFIMLMTVGFGYAKPVPVNPFNFKHQKTGIFTVAIAGVTVNLLMAFFSCGLMFLMIYLQSVWVDGARFLNYFEMFFNVMVMINLSFMLFNLLPIHPLDGFRVIEAFTKFSNPVTKFFRDYGQFILIFLVGISILVDLLLRYTGLPSWIEYFDIIGLYINAGRSGITWLFDSFWGLFLR